MRLIFNQTTAPQDLITVHIRWGDKGTEMELASVEEFIGAVRELLRRRRTLVPVNVFVATEDPRATHEFRQAAPLNWTV